jgi:O-antigen/teichoic acid export membrane protein
VNAILRATAILSSSSLVSILVGLVSAKAYALLIGPVGTGHMGLLQGLIGLAGLIAALGIGTGLVRLGAGALGEEDAPRFAALRRAAWGLALLSGGVMASLLVLFREPVSSLMLGGVSHSGAVWFAAAALIINLASEVQTGILNAHHRVASLAQIGVINSVLGVLAGVAFVWRWGEGGIVAAVVVVPLIAWLTSRVYLKRDLPASSARVNVRETLGAARALLRFGLPYTLSMIAGAGVQLLIPVLVLKILGEESVGYYRAAVTLSVTYLGFLLSAMALDYFPRISAVSTQPEALRQLVNQQHRVVMMLGVPMILGMLALAPYLIPLVYSNAFTPAVAIVEWQLIGDILKFSSWTMSFVILARSGSLVFLLTEIVGGGTYLASSWLGMHFFGLSGLGAAHLVTYAVYAFVVMRILVREIDFRPTAENVSWLALSLLAAFTIHALPSLGLAGSQLPVALVIACLAALGSFVALRREMGNRYRVQTD